MKKQISAIVTVFLLTISCFSAFADGETVLNASAGLNNSFFITGDGTLFAVGQNDNGKLGDGSEQTKSTMIKVFSDAKKVSAGGAHTLILKNDSTLWTVGAGSLGQLGNGTEGSSAVPVKILDDVVTMSAGYSYNAAIKADGTLWAWGYNNKEIFASEQANVINLPVMIDTDCKDVSCGMYGMLILKNDGTLMQKFGEASFVSSDVSKAVNGREHNAFLKYDLSLSTWGLNISGQLGNGTNTDTTEPVVMAYDVSEIAAGNSHTLFIKNDSSLWAVGSNEYGQLGDGTTTSKNTSVFIMDNVKSIYTSANHNIAIKHDGSVWGWGDNKNAQLTGYNKPIVATPSRLSVAIAGGEPSSWAKNEVNQARGLSLLTTEVSGNYQKNITREEFADLIINMLQKNNLTMHSDESPFSDTTNPNITLAYSLGIVNGTSETEFSPYKNITRQEIATMFYRMIQNCYPEYTVGIPADLSFSDNNLIADWASNAVYFVNASGIVNGVGDNMFDPEGKSTAEQAILLVLRTYNLFEN